MTDAKKKLFGLFSTKKKAPEHQQPPSQPKDHDKVRTRRRERSTRPRDPDSAGRYPKGEPSKSRSTLPTSGSVNSSSRHVARTKSLPPPLTEWPPDGIPLDAALSLKQALQYITPGAPIFKGTRRFIPHASEEYYNLYASYGGNADAGSDCGDAYTAAFEVDSLSLRHHKAASHAWETLEQPSMAFCYGTRPGEISLNHWVSLSRNPSPQIELRESSSRPRAVELSTILNRLISLEGGFEEDHEDLRYKNLYHNLLKDSDRFTRPHKSMEKQIEDLIIVLSSREWIDFSLPQNQVVAKFFANTPHADHGEGKVFFHQLLLSMELYYRVYSAHFEDGEREILVRQLPPSISWSLAVARKWRECIRIEPFKVDEKGKIRFTLRNKHVQVKALRRFARVMKWPNLLPVDNVLKERNHSARPLEERSSDSLSYFSGMVLPGVTLPWLVMNTLIDCDADAGVNALAALTHMHPCCGFQYRSTTYWSAQCIVGKVLAPSCKAVAGWIGPARPAPDLSRISIARIRQRPLKEFVSPTDVLDMNERSDPLGPSAKTYPVSEYTLPMPEIDPEYLTNNIRIEKLALKLVHQSVTSVSTSRRERDKPQLYDAAVQFAIAGESWPLRLSYDVSFISACPCARGPHPLFFDYSYQTTKIEDLLSIRNWGLPQPPTNNTTSTLASQPTSKSWPTSPPSSNASKQKSNAKPDPNDPEAALDKVLVVEAFGIADNEVLARAWCSHWALSAVVADMEKTCLGCAVREAYAACIKVVIIVEAMGEEEE